MFSIGTYQNFTSKETQSSVVRVLTNQKMPWPFIKLEAPNLISDFAANIFSFCMHCNVKCTLFIVYTDVLSYDYLNTGPLLDIFYQMNLPLVKLFRVKPVMLSGNLYV